MTILDGVVLAASLRGAAGVRAYLQAHGVVPDSVLVADNRQSLHELLDSFASPALLTASTHSRDASPPEFGLQIETLPLSVQRELWSAFVKWRSIFPTRGLEELTNRFLSVVEKDERQHRAADAVCVHLAVMLRHEFIQDEEHRHGLSGMMEEAATDDVASALEKLVYVPKETGSKSSVRGDEHTTKKRRRSADMDATTIDSSHHVESRGPQLNVRPKTATLPSETEVRVSAIGAKLAQLGSSDVSTDQASKTAELVTAAVDSLCQIMNDVNATQQDNEELFRVVCTKLQLRTTSEEALCQVTNSLMEANWSSRYAAIYLDAIVLPRVLGATSVISRVLVQTVLLYAKPAYATALVDGLLVPLITAPSIGISQGEAVTRLLREKCVPTDQLDSLLGQALKIRTNELLANEATIQVFQNVLNMKPALSGPTVDLLASAITSALEQEANRDSLLKSAKFASLLFTLVSKYAPLCRPHGDDFSSVACQLTSTMGKSTLRVIQKLKH